ncbi:TPA: ead/Ea22-like family protein [Citrobacter freundii]|uniref:ead/Ea22-like family protein n=1 Tax=Citrobacter freundii TaxID=546 RepID=UPI0020911604|nr:ead/Ea22-like family protein [Citrobacter freundii]MCO5743585.1 ead/Ea22-like family protein [Citrobacter freundii]MCO5749477.1 ead/Ea22-like family protein [Citrobacter freundii]MCO5757438.1 ead/Ea22-like family protein [Citrobacter freundii]MCO5764792.1 ead/Ea22-like family protein [Citrobacter freundii]MCO5770280.1 ead/Ea22-like family protein [Citrobacter freundii]
MTALNKQALREVANAANIASWGKWESYKPHKGARGYEVKVGAKAVAQHCLKVDAAFIAAANPQTVLALLDELESAEERYEDMLRRARSFREAHDSAAEIIRKLERNKPTVTLPTTRLWAGKVACYEECEIREILRAAGIGLKGE